VDTHHQKSNRIVSQEDLWIENEDQEIEGLNTKNRNLNNSMDSDDGMHHDS